MRTAPFNPSGWRQRIPLAILCALATLIAVYLGLYQWGLIDHIWDPFFGSQSEEILLSEAADLMREWIRIPDAILGAVSYLGDILFSLAGSTMRWRDRPWLVLIFGLYVIPPAFASILLVFLQGVVLQKWCFFCLVSAAISIGMIFLSYNEVAVMLRFLWRIYREGGRVALWSTFWGNPSHLAWRVSCAMEKEYVAARS